MTWKQPKSAGRAGFTLIELLVVIAIIAIIMGLLLVAVLRLLGMPADIQNRKDIEDMSAALEKFKSKYGVYPPSRILLSNDPAQYNNSQIGRDSAKYLTRIWSRLDLTKRVDWDGNPNSAIYSVVLEGDQCLVFFLGGIPNPSPPGCRGFADSASQPTNLSLPNKVRPFFDFKSHRLFRRGTHPFYSYKDAYEGKPFAYFSAGFSANGYNAADCASLGVAPYVESTTGFAKYWNPKSFQIISAGRDEAFGAGGVWNALSPTVSTQGQDDMSNFSGSLLGQPRS